MGKTCTAVFLCAKGSPKRRTLYRSPVMGLIPSLAGQLFGGFAEPFNGFQFLVAAVHLGDFIV